MRKWLLLVLPFVLAGCWDEQNYNTTIHVPMAGISGELGELEISFALPALERKTEDARIITVAGRSFQDAKTVADASTHNQLDTSMLTALLISEDSAKTNLYGYLDGFYRDVRNRLGMSVIITEGPAKSYVEKSGEFGENINTFYSEMTRHLYQISQLPLMDLQHACTYLFDEAIDLQLPYMKTGKDGFPEIAGVALFDDRRFTGEIIEMKDMVLMQLMKSELGKIATDVTLYEDSPLSYEIERANRDVKTDEESIHFSYELEVSILDYYPDRIIQPSRRKDMKKAIEDDLHFRAAKIIEQMKSANHDGLGVGRYYRAFRPQQYKEQNWKETYQELEIHTQFIVTVRDSGIMD